jgi:hypothetical protein
MEDRGCVSGAPSVYMMLAELRTATEGTIRLVRILLETSDTSYAELHAEHRHPRESCRRPEGTPVPRLVHDGVLLGMSSACSHHRNRAGHIRASDPVLQGVQPATRIIPTESRRNEAEAEAES